MSSRISYSQISLYNECPLHWKLRYVDRLALSESSIHLVFGTAMLEVIQTYLEVMYHDSIKNAKNLNLEEMLRDNMIIEFKKAVYEKIISHFSYLENETCRESRE